jgi:hypothetical protein
VVGGGPIGRAMRESLSGRMGLRVDLHDVDATTATGDHSALKRELRSILNNYDVIVGATGTEILSASDIPLMSERAVIFSVSSSDREFNAHSWRAASDQKVSGHDAIEVGGRILLNNGFPLNFDGGEESVPLEEIQLTGALTVASLLHGTCLHESSGGFVELPRDLQLKVAIEFAREHS